MLGAFKRRWKPKRGSAEKENNNQSCNNNKKISHAKTENILAMDVARVTVSQRQIHPLVDDKAHLVAYSDTNEEPQPPSPNICVEGGRIEFVRSPSGGSSGVSCGGRIEFVRSPSGGSSGGSFKRSPSEGSNCPNGAPLANFRRFSERGATSTTSGSLSSAASCAEKSDLAKEVLEARVRELERLLEAEQQSGQRERLAVSRLQRQLARREVVNRDVERERRRRVDIENKCREAAGEAQRYRASLAKLQREFNRMEESVRSMVHLKSRCDVLTQEKTSLAAAYESRVQTYQTTIGKLGQENEQLRQQLRMVRSLGSGGSEFELSESSFFQNSPQHRLGPSDLEDGFFLDGDTERNIHGRCFDRLRALEAENASLSEDSDTARRQYERCLDDIANQVVRALLSQKGLREEIGNLQRRIKDLENQNQALANILVHRLSRGGGEGETWVGMFSPSPLRPDSPLTTPPRRRLPLDSPVSTPLGDRRNLRLHSLESPLCTPMADGGRRSLRLHSLDSLLVLPLQRPRSLHLETFTAPSPSGRRTHRRSKPALVVPVKKPAEQDEGNESPESGNRDEGYSTMSSDVQVLGETSEVSRLGLEDLKEATDEGEEPGTETLVLPLVVSARNSFPPFQHTQHVMRSFSDSHLCLRGLPQGALLRRSRAAASLAADDSGGESVGSTGSGWWDQHWLRLDDTRQGELEMDRSELENWSLSCEDMVTGLPSIRELDDSWSSGGSSCAGSLVSEPSEPSAAVGTDFTRDFYRLVKFESTRSLESASSRSHGPLETCQRDGRDVSYDRELALQSVLSFIAEQQQYCHSREEEDTSLHTPTTPPSPKDCYRTEKDCTLTLDSGKRLPRESEREESGKCEKLQRTENFSKCLESKCSNKGLDEERLVPVAEEEEDAVKDVVDVPEMAESLTSSLSTPDTVVGAARMASPLRLRTDIVTGPTPATGGKTGTEPKRRLKTGARETKIPVISTRKLEPSSPRRVRPDRRTSNIPQSATATPSSNIPITSPRCNISATSQASSSCNTTHVPISSSNTSQKSSSSRIPQTTSDPLVATTIPLARSRRDSTHKTSPESCLVVGTSTLSFHERASSKDVIEELNRMIRKGEDPTPQGSTPASVQPRPLDLACARPTGWVHVERDIDFTDPKARANLLDVMLASSGSSDGGSDSGGDDPADYTHLHRIHRFRRHKKAAVRDCVGALRWPLTSARPSIVGRDGFFVRFGRQEEDAVATFDFLEDFSTTSISTCGSTTSSSDAPGSSLPLRSQQKALKSVPTDLPLRSSSPEDCSPTSSAPADLMSPATPGDDSDDKNAELVSFSDSCADSYSSEEAH